MNKKNRARGRPRGHAAAESSPNIQSLDRALNILEVVANSGGMTLTEIASEMDQSVSTVFRVLATLENHQIVEVDQATQTWHIGPATFRLGSTFLRREGLLDRSRPVMRHLMEATGETANLGIERAGQVLFVSQVETLETIRAFFPPGTQSPMHSSGIGKALLSQFSDFQVTRYLRRNTLERFTDQTITNADALRAELRSIQMQGYSFDNEERTQGMRCVAAPVTDQYGEAIAGISISGPVNRMPTGAINSIAVKVVAAAATLSQQMGRPD